MGEEEKKELKITREEDRKRNVARRKRIGKELEGERESKKEEEKKKT